MKEIFSKFLSFGKWTIILVIVFELLVVFAGGTVIIDELVKPLMGPEQQEASPTTDVDEDGCILIIGRTGKSGKVCQ